MFSKEGFRRFEIAVLEAVEDGRIKLVVVDQTGDAFSFWIGNEAAGGESPQDRGSIEFRDMVVKEVLNQPFTEVRVNLLVGGLTIEELVDLREAVGGAVIAKTLEFSFESGEEIGFVVDGRDGDDATIVLIADPECEM